MKASYYTCNKTFAVEPIEAVTPSAGEVAISVAYCGLCGTDLHVYHGNMDMRVGCHRIIGHEMSGTVNTVGEGVDDLAVGDKVVVRPLVACGECPACSAGNSHICHSLKFLGLDTDGALQQSWNVPRHTVHRLPADMSLKHAALVEPLAVACHDVDRSRLAAGEDVLIIGGGPIGMVARERGGNIWISEINENRRQMAESFGFQVIDPAGEDVGKFIHGATGSKGADVVFEVSGSQAGIDAMTTAVAARGRIVMVAIHSEKPEVDLFRFFWREIEMLGARVYTGEDFETAIGLIASGAIDCDSIITNVQDISQVGELLSELSGNPSALKSLIRVCEENLA